MIITRERAGSDKALHSSSDAALAAVPTDCSTGIHGGWGQRLTLKCFFEREFLPQLLDRAGDLSDARADVVDARAPGDAAEDQSCWHAASKCSTQALD